MTDETFGCTVGIIIWNSHGGTKIPVELLVRRFSQTSLSSINLCLEVLTVDEAKRSFVRYRYYHMVVGGNQKIQSETKTSMGNRNMILKFLSPIELVVLPRLL